MTGYVLEKLEDGFITYLSQSYVDSGSYSGSAVNFYKGIESVDKEGIHIIAFANHIEDIEPGVQLGIYATDIGVQIQIPYDPDETYTTRNTIVQDFTQFLTGNNLVANISSSSDSLYIYHVECNGQDSSFMQNAYVYSMNYTVVAALTD